MEGKTLFRRGNRTPIRAHRLKESIDRSVAALVVAAMTMSPAVASAQEASAVAEALYREGKRLFEAGHVAEACVKFAESQRVEPALGTLLNLANCHEKEGKTASAWAEFTTVADKAGSKGQTERATFAREQAKALQKKLRLLVFDVKQPSPGIAIKVDNEALGSAALGVPLPLDPGTHRITVSASEKKDWVHELTLADGPGTTHVDVPALEDAPRPIVMSPPVSLDSKSADSTSVDSKSADLKSADLKSADSTPADPRRSLGLVIGGAGVLALGTGVFFGVRSLLLDQQGDREADRAAELAKKNSLDPDIRTQTDASVRDRDDASTHRNIGLIAGGVGVAAIGAGIYFLVTSKGSAKESSPAGHTSGIRDFRLAPLAGPHVNGASASFAF